MIQQLDTPCNKLGSIRELNNFTWIDITVSDFVCKCVYISLSIKKGFDNPDNLLK